LEYQVADDANAEAHAPCELGGYLLNIRAFHKVIYSLSPRARGQAE
jgi:hypothetical protein